MKDVKCPRWGYVRMTTKMGKEFIKETICKTWGCPVCKSKMVAMVKMRMEYGCSKLGRCYLITLTLKAGLPRERKTAASVRLEWERWLKSMRSRNPNLSWFKVVEATKKGTPHLHLLMGTVGKRKDQCDEDPVYSRRYAVKKCDCLMHECLKAWFEITGNYVVDCARIFNVEGAVGYLAKYLSKSFQDREVLVELGYKRRWSRSQNWPSPEEQRLQGSIEEAWESVEVLPRYYKRPEMERLERNGEGHRLMETVGDPEALGIMREHKRQYLAKKLGRMANVDAII